MTSVVFWPLYLKFILSTIFILSLLASLYTFYVQDSIYFITYFNTKFAKPFFGNKHTKVLNRSFAAFFSKFFFNKKSLTNSFKKMF